MKRAVSFFAILLFLAFCGPLGAVENDRKGLHALEGDQDIGIVFNIPDILFDFESYQGSVGFKIGLDHFTIRGLIGLLVYNQMNPFSFNIGAAMEFHFLPGRISPYWGGFMNLGVAHLKNVTDSANWEEVTTFPLSLGGLGGIEIFIFDFLSLFVEYSLEFSLNIHVNTNSENGSVSTNGSYDFNLDLGIGNQSQIGVTIYFFRKPIEKQ